MAIIKAYSDMRKLARETVLFALDEEYPGFPMFEGIQGKASVFYEMYQDIARKYGPMAASCFAFILEQEYEIKVLTA